MHASGRMQRVVVHVQTNLPQPLGCVFLRFLTCHVPHAPFLVPRSLPTISRNAATVIFSFLLGQDKARTTLTMEDLSAALAEYGINSRKPEFYM